MLKVTLKDNSSIEVEKGTSILEVAKKISEGLARNATCGEVDGEVKDLRYELQEDCNLVIHTFPRRRLGREKSILAYNITYYGTSCKKIIPRCKISHRTKYR